MANKTFAVVSALLTLILFVGVPYLLPDYIPQDLATQIEQSGFDLSEYTNQVMKIGVATAVLTLVGGFVNPTRMISLLVKIAQAVFSLVLIIVFLGAGDIASLGYTTFNVTMDGVQSSIAMDLRIFVYFSIATILLKVIQVYLEWNEARIEAAPPGRIAP